MSNTSTYRLLDRKQAQQQLEDCRRTATERAERIARNETDYDDCFVSDWGNSTMVRHAQFCIEAWDLGEQHGYDVPAGSFCSLFQNGNAIPSRIIDTQYGSSWIILDETWVTKLGRKFIPLGSNSRIQKKLGLYEDNQIKPCKNYVLAHCGALCGAVTFRLVAQV